MAVKEIAGGSISGEPVAMQQKIVHVIRENELLDNDAASAQARDEIDRLREVDVAIVIAVDEKHRRLPCFDGGDWRRLVSELGQRRRNVLSIPIVRGPIVNAVEIDAGSEDIRVTREAHRGEEPTVTATPKADTRRIDIGPALKIFSGGDDVSVFGGAAACATRRFSEGTAITNAAAIVHREQNVPTPAQTPIHPVGIRWVIHVAPAAPNFADGSAGPETHTRVR